MNAVCTPLGIGLGLAAGQRSKRIFDFVWGLFDDEEATGTWPGEERPKPE